LKITHWLHTSCYYPCGEYVACSSNTLGKMSQAIKFPAILAFFVSFIIIIFPYSTFSQTLFPNSTADNANEKRVLTVDGVSDSQLETRLNGVLSNIDSLKNVEATVRDGVVVLTGKTSRAEARRKAEELVSRFEGVVYVTNKVEIESEVEGRVNPAIAKVKEYLNKILEQLPVIGIAILVVVVFWLLSLLVLHWDAPYKRLRINPLLHGLIRQMLRAIILLLGILFALDILDVTALVGAIVGAAGLLGLAIGFGVRDIVENYLAGILLSLRSPFTVNDLVQVENHEGRVVRLTSREMVLMTLDGNHVRIPNSLVFKSVIHNYTRNPRRRFDFKVGVGVDENLTAVQDVGCSTLRVMEGVMDDPGPFMRVVQLGDFNVTVQFFGWVDQRAADFLKVQSEAIRLVKAALDKAGVEMPVPIQTVRSREILPPETMKPSSEKRTPPEFVEQKIKKADVSIDRQLDEQIEEDQAISDEKNLLAD
jgi:small conductance mechanosensitive channel